MDKITVLWHGHACFSITAGGQTLVIDPYDDSMEGYPPLRLTGNAVLCSHTHHDHNFTDGVTLTKTDGPSVFTVGEVASFHDDNVGGQRGKNTIFVVKVFGKTLVHLGDLGHKLTPKQLGEIGRCDLVMIPVGGYYTIDAATASEVLSQLNPTVAVPMHYRFDGHGPAVVGTVEDFIKTTQNIPVHTYPDNRFELTDETEKQIAVLKFAE